MKKNAGVFTPASHWEEVDIEFRKSEGKSLNLLLDAFIGSEGLKPIDIRQKTLYEKLFSVIDKLGLSQNLDNEKKAN